MAPLSNEEVLRMVNEALSHLGDTRLTLAALEEKHLRQMLNRFVKLERENKILDAKCIEYERQIHDLSNQTRQS
jgi:hypothetical protein